MLGISVGRPLVLAVAPSHRAALHRVLSTAGPDGADSILEFELRGGTASMEVRCRPIRPGELLVVLRDVTAWMAAWQRIARLEGEERVLAEQLRAFDEARQGFLLAVSHDLRTPLAAIAGLAELLESKPRLRSTERRSAVTQIRRQARDVLSMFGDIMDVARIERGGLPLRRRLVDVGALVHEVVARIDTLGRTISIDAPSEGASVDPGLVERIVENLVRNAVQHTPADARIWVQCRREPDGVLLRVDDDGLGVPGELAPRVFELFQRGREPGTTGGLGVGLNLVRGFAELHGGYARVGDRPGGGASFHVLLPESAPVA